MLVLLYYTQFSRIGFTHCYDTLITNNHAVLSTLPDNPGDSRRSPSLQIRVSQFLLKNRQLAKLLFFFYTQLSDHEISNILRCLSYCGNVPP